MISAPLPHNEEERLRKLRELDILDTLEELAYDDLTALVAQILDVPISLVSLVDENRQWFKSHHGLDARETPRELAFCAHAILGEGLFVVEDADHDQRFKDNPLVTQAPFVKFYAGAPLQLPGGAKIGTLCAIDNHARHITQKQKDALEAVARQVEAQLTLRLKVKELTRLDQLKDEFLSMVTHELRTPLTSILGSLVLMQSHRDKLTAEKFEQLTNIATRNSKQLLVLVNDMLDIAHLQAGTLAFHIDEVNVDALIENALTVNQPYANELGVSFYYQKSDAATLMAVGDFGRLTQMLTNLLSNAAKFTHLGDRIEVTAAVEGGRIEIAVVDHGPGVPLDKQDQLFKRFSQVHSAQNEKKPGTGLGLFLCKQFALQQGGDIVFNSQPNVETRFCIRVPMAN